MDLGLEGWRDEEQREENGPYKRVGSSQGYSLAGIGHCKLRLEQFVRHPLFCQGFRPQGQNDYQINFKRTVEVAGRVIWNSGLGEAAVF